MNAKDATVDKQYFCEKYGEMVNVFRKTETCVLIKRLNGEIRIIKNEDILMETEEIDKLKQPKKEQEPISKKELKEELEKAESQPIEEEEKEAEEETKEASDEIPNFESDDEKTMEEVFGDEKVPEEENQEEEIITSDPEPEISNNKKGDEPKMSKKEEKKKEAKMAPAKAEAKVKVEKPAKAEAKVKVEKPAKAEKPKTEKEPETILTICGEIKDKLLADKMLLRDFNKHALKCDQCGLFLGNNSRHTVRKLEKNNIKCEQTDKTWYLSKM